MRKIAVTIIAFITTFIILSLTLTGFIALLNAKDELVNEATTQLETLTLNTALELETKIYAIESDVSHLNTISQITFENQGPVGEATKLELTPYRHDLDRVIHHAFDQKTAIESVFLILEKDHVSDAQAIIYTRQEDGGLRAINTSEITAKLQQHTYETNWFYLPMLQRKAHWTEPVLSDNASALVMRYSEPILIDNQVVGVVGVNLLFNDLTDFINAVDAPNSGYAFLMNSNHDYLVHPIFDTNTNMRTMENGLLVPISNKIGLNDYGAQHYNFYNQEKIMGYTHLHNGWIIGIESNAESLQQTFFSTKKIVYPALATCVVLLIMATLITMRYRTRSSEKRSAMQAQKNQHTTLEQLSEQNKKMNHLIIEKSDDVNRLIKDLETSNESLKHAQQTIFELREQEVINDLIQHITNKLSNPIANSITASSFLLSKNKADDVQDSLTLILNNQQQMKTIIDSLKQLMMNFNEEMPRYFPIRAHLSHTIRNELSVNLATELQTIVEGDDQLMAYLPMDLFSKLMSNLIHHSIRASKNCPAATLSIRVYKEEEAIHILYYDIIPWQSGLGERIFNPYFRNQFISDASGLDLYIVKHTIVKGFLGSIEAFETPDGHLGFHITLPSSVLKP
ncbi:MAG: sensor histidine kinase [Clostridia bacterium]|nr:sensor histidine kinase [Clostridia bacterium]